MIYAKPTTYNGITFRSRLEARWAVYFDAIGITYEYEMERYDFTPDMSYLPDFYLREVNMWAEVKPVQLDGIELTKVEYLVLTTEIPCLLLVGSPQAKPYEAIYFERSHDNLRNWTQSYWHALSNYHDYPQYEGRFYIEDSPNSFGGEFAINGEYHDAVLASIKAKNAFKFI